eukprot:6760283-Pyramimonas_sp.AAC.1
MQSSPDVPFVSLCLVSPSRYHQPVQRSQVRRILALIRPVVLPANTERVHQACISMITPHRLCSKL